MRAIDCPCGTGLHAEDDDRLFEVLRDHAGAEHPGRYEDWELRQLVVTSSYEREAESVR